MNTGTYKLIIFAVILFLGLFLDVSAQSETDEVANAKKRAETLLQTIREEKWNDLDKFVVIITEQMDKETGKRVKSFHKIDDEETKEKVIARFKQTYSLLKPGNIIEVRINEKDKTIAGVSYRHGDKDGFTMALLDGEWYYTIEYLYL